MRRARWTCATLAAATGFSSNSLNSSADRLAESASIVVLTLRNENGGRRSCSERSWSMISGANRSGRVYITWPSLMNVAPSVRHRLAQHPAAQRAERAARGAAPRRTARCRAARGRRRTPHRSTTTSEEQEVEEVTGPAQHGGRIVTHKPRARARVSRRARAACAMRFRRLARARILGAASQP